MPAWAEEGDESPTANVPYSRRVFHGRNYDLFAILADVRNGRGFAGISTGRGFEPISTPRGLPADVCERVRAISDSWSIDGHSHSYHTLAQLTAFDWTQETTRRGVVDGVTWSRWQRDLHWEGPCLPDSFCAATSRELITEEQMRERVRELVESDSYRALHHGAQQNELRAAVGNAYCEFSIDLPYYKCCPYFWSNVMPRLFALRRDYGDVRIVFLFDN